jgi:phosphoglycerate dehydrogenase-like enzyme
MKQIQIVIPDRALKDVDEILREAQVDNFILTPHIAGWTVESVRAEAVIIADNLYRLNQGKVLLPLTLVNPDVANIQ